MRHVPLHPDLVGAHRLIQRQRRPCWIWDGAVDGNGYPRARWHRAGSTLRPSVYVRRQNYQSTWGRLEHGDRVRMRCNHRRCVNPFHMTLDPAPPGRWRRPASARLSAGKVIEIRKAWARPDRPTQAELGDAYGVSRSTISLVVRRKTWCHV